MEANRGKYLICVWLLFLFMETSTISPRNFTSGVNPRKGKVLSLFQIVQFQNGFCIGSGSRNGTCFTQAECDSRGGNSVGSCANGFGVCCAITLSCGQTSAENCTYLVQTSASTIPNPCQYTICPANNNICRIRFDFTTFNINGPVTGLVETDLTMSAESTGGGAIGDCTSDTLSVTSPGNFAPPVICGFNSGQHMIVDASPNQCNQAIFGTRGTGTREWDIKVTQYSCGDEEGGPDGCLQYFTGMTGTVASFNFPTNTPALALSTTHLSSQNQPMCWRQEANTCSICWIPEILGDNVNIAGSFGIGNSGGGRVAQGEVDGKCRGDVLLIPNAKSKLVTDVNFNDRVCGRFFNADENDPREKSVSVCTDQRPFRLTFLSDADEITLESPAKAKNPNFANRNELNRNPGGIIGFNLRWTLQTCP